jgi:hypothetical protein
MEPEASDHTFCRTYHRRISTSNSLASSLRHFVYCDLLASSDHSLLGLRPKTCDRRTSRHELDRSRIASGRRLELGARARCGFIRRADWRTCGKQRRLRLSAVLIRLILNGLWRSRLCFANNPFDLKVTPPYVRNGGEGRPVRQSRCAAMAQIANGGRTHPCKRR